NWKVEVLSDLYFRASRKFAAVDPVGASRSGDDRHAVWQQFTTAEREDPGFGRQLGAIPGSFFCRRSAPSVADALRRLRNLAPRSGAAWANYLPETDTVEFIAGIDQGSGRAIFSSMAGALTSKNMQIMAAETNTLADDLLLLRYVAS